MKPVVIFRHAASEGPGFLGSFLNDKGIPWTLVKIDQGDPLPHSMRPYSGMVLMGGPMSVNDDLPWIAPLLALIQEAIASDIPVLGHCLGGQLISRALGATVMPNSIKEIGWGEVRVERNAIARNWFRNRVMFEAFHWHGETFSLPAGAVRILSGIHCPNQAYAIGNHVLAFQCHIEMTAEMVNNWCEIGAGEIAESAESPGVQHMEKIQQNLEEKVHALNAVAKPVYEQWIKYLKV